MNEYLTPLGELARGDWFTFVNTSPTSRIFSKTTYPSEQGRAQPVRSCKDGYTEYDLEVISVQPDQLVQRVDRLSED